MLITRKSMYSGRIHTFEIPGVTQEQVDAYIKLRPLIQRAFPQLTPEQREFIKTGITDAEWNEMFEEDKKEGF